VPVLPGFKLLYNQKQLTKIPATFGVSLPPAMIEAFEACRTAEEEKKDGLEAWLRTGRKTARGRRSGDSYFYHESEGPGPGFA